MKWRIKAAIPEHLELREFQKAVIKNLGGPSEVSAMQLSFLNRSIEVLVILLMMCQALERGKDNTMIDYISEMVKRKVIQELKSFNYQRPEKVNLSRRG